MTIRGPQDVRRDRRRGRPRRAVIVDGDRSAALLVRVWLEDGAEAFRGRITNMDTSPYPGNARETTIALAASPGDVVDAVRAWLEDFLGDAANSIDGDE